MTTVFDAGGEGSAKACWALMRRARADRFESANSAAIPSPFQGLVFPRPKKPDRYWSAPRDAKRPAISVVEIGYVRRSEPKLLLTGLRAGSNADRTVAAAADQRLGMTAGAHEQSRRSRLAVVGA